MTSAAIHRTLLPGFTPDATARPLYPSIWSPCRMYRYALWRIWDYGPACQFIGLNPSIADDFQDDPTIRRCIAFAKSWGCGSLCMTNLFAFRSTDPRVMKAAADPVGPDNDRVLREVRAACDTAVACWGAHGTFRNRGQEVLPLLPDLQCLGLTKWLQPKHPLYLASSTELMPFGIAT